MIELIKIALSEDLGDLKDITSRSIFTEDSFAKAVIVAKESGIIAGVKIVKEVFNTVDSNLKLTSFVDEGQLVTSETELFFIEGKTISILEGERVALNIFSHMSGIATLVNHHVKAVAGSGVKILDTRKTLPGLREIEKQAVISGGGVNHRWGLYDRVLIKDNHIDGIGGITPAVGQIRKTYGEQFFIEVETRNINEVSEAVKCHVDQILLDNMSITQLQEAVKLVDHQIPLEASGNVSLTNVKSIAETGVQFISIGSITLSSQALDLSLRFI